MPDVPDNLGLLPNRRAVDKAVASYIGKDKKKDVTRGKPYKVNVYQDDGHSMANRAKLDLDRDDRWNEKWTFRDDGTVQRQVAPDDDEAYTVKEVWGPDGWTAE